MISLTEMSLYLPHVVSFLDRRQPFERANDNLLPEDIPEIENDATEIGRRPSHLRRVLAGERWDRKSWSLYRNLKGMQREGFEFVLWRTCELNRKANLLGVSALRLKLVLSGSISSPQLTRRYHRLIANLKTCPAQKGLRATQPRAAGPGPAGLTTQPGPHPAGRATTTEETR